MSAGGGERGTARAETPMPPVNAWPSSNAADTTRQRTGHQRPVAWAIKQRRGRHHPSTRGPSTRTPPQRQHDQTQLRHDERGGGVRGRPCRNADATCRRVGHRATRPTPPVRAAHAATPMPPVDAWAIEQSGRHHPSTRGAINADSSSATARPNAIAAPGGTTSAGWGRGATCAAMRLTPPVNARATNAVLKNIKNRLTWHWRRAGEDIIMLAMTDNG